MKTSVLIVGAGPTGLVMAIWLRRKGIDFKIIDKAAKAGETSRAIAIQARTLEFYHQLGIAEKIISSGVMVPEFVLRRNGDVVANARMGALGKGKTPYPYLIFCPQDVHEKILQDLLEKENVQVERSTELIDFSQDDRRVYANIQGPQGKQRITADYIVGCDGAHSSIRHGLHVDFPGGTYDQIFYVADVVANGEMAQGTVQISVSKKDFTIVMPIRSKSSVRLIGIVPRELETKPDLSFEDLKESVYKNTKLQIQSANWFSIYHVHHRVASHFQQGRAFICGDAGHIHSPAGGQGMNTGIGDAVNLAWKLADVIQKRSSEKILESYESERAAFAKTLISTTDTAFRFIASQGFFGSLFRAYIIPILFAFLSRFKGFLRFIFKTISQTKISYRQSYLSVGRVGDLYSGDRLPWVKYTATDNYKPLRSLDWQVHVYGTANEALKIFLENAKIDIYEFPWSRDAKIKSLTKDAVYLVRPDGHIAFADEKQNVVELDRYLMACRSVGSAIA